MSNSIVSHHASKSASRLGPRTCARRMRGFTFTELVVAAGATATLVSVALPNLTAPLLRARRADALVALAQVQAAQERWLTQHGSYGNLSDIGASDTSPSGHYRIAVRNAGPEGYTLTATALGAQASDALCAQLEVEIASANVWTRSGQSATQKNTAADNQRCWAL